MFELICQACREHVDMEFYPRYFLIDFESSTMKAVTEIFRNSSLHLCFFHFTSNIYR